MHACCYSNTVSVWFEYYQVVRACKFDRWSIMAQSDDFAFCLIQKIHESRIWMKILSALTRNCSSWSVECLRLAGISKDGLLVIFLLFGLLFVSVVGEKMEWPGFLLRGFGASLALLSSLPSFPASLETFPVFFGSVSITLFVELVYFGRNQVRTKSSALKSSIWLCGKEAISSFIASVAVASARDICVTACQIRDSMSTINFGLSFPSSLDV